MLGAFLSVPSVFREALLRVLTFEHIGQVQLLFIELIICLYCFGEIWVKNPIESHGYCMEVNIRSVLL